MKHILLLFSFLILAVLPARAQWRDAKFPVQVLAFGEHDTNLFLSNVPPDQGFPQSYLDSLVFRYQDGGWIALGSGLDRTQGTITSFASLGSEIYCGQTQSDNSPGPINVSTNNGSSWQETAIGAGVIFSNGRYLFSDWGTYDGAKINWYIARSINGGITWDSVLNSYANYFCASGATMLASTSNGLYRSTNSGAAGTWSLVTTPISDIQTFAVVGTVIYAANGTQLMRSTDSGATWELVNTSFNVAYLASDSVHLFAGGSGGVYYLDQQSGNWIYESGDTSVLDNRGIVALGVFDTLLFADFASSAHQNYQLFMRSIPEMTEKSGVAAMSQSEDTIVIYPNPAMDRVTIISGGTSIYGVRVLNVLGEEITKTTFRGLGSGNVELDLSKLSTGTYFLEIQTRNGVVFRKIILER